MCLIELLVELLIELLIELVLTNESAALHYIALPRVRGRAGELTNEKQLCLVQGEVLRSEHGR